MRTYIFGDGKKIKVDGYLTPEEIKENESKFGLLKSVTFGTKTVRCLQKGERYGKI